eukprot:9362218-Pyramimonas_sp.AAC.1
MYNHVSYACAALSPGSDPEVRYAHVGGVDGNHMDATPPCIAYGYIPMTGQSDAGARSEKTIDKAQTKPVRSATATDYM